MTRTMTHETGAMTRMDGGLRRAGLALLAAAGLCLGGRAAPPDPLAARVAADFPGAPDAPFHHYAVPAMGERPRLPGAYPDDGLPGGTVTIVAARDEYEPGSFLVWGARDLGKVAFSLGAFRNERGDVFPAEDLDLKVVKVWYQNRNGWFSYFGDTGFKLLPELLLNDEDLIRVDEKRTTNYARLVAPDGTRREHWLNPPRQLNARPLREPWRSSERFHCMRADFDDAATLQPVAVERGKFKQLFLTAHVRRDAKPGLYRGVVRVGTLGEIPVAIRVLDFVLPAPKCYGDPRKDFLVSSYSYICQDQIAELNGYDVELARRQLVAVLRNQVAHNQTMHMVRGNMDPKAFDCIAAMREAGMRTDVLQAGVSPRVQDSREESRARAQRVADELDRRYGHHNVFVGYGDEPGAAWLAKARPVYEDYQRAGLRFFIAGHDAVFHRAGYLYDWHNIAKDPSDSSSTKLWNALQNGNRIAWYANHHVGTENPAFNRRQNGLAAYLSGYTALCNYAHHFGPYNDDSTTYKPMVFAYGRYGGVIDTLQWEGFREGIDDIRYATLMTDLARKAQTSADVRLRYLGGQAMQMLAALDVKGCDQDACRAEMVRFIEALRPHVPAYDVGSDWAGVSAAARAAATKRLDAGLAKELAEAKAGFAAAKGPGQTNDVHRKVAAVYERYFRHDEAGAYLAGVGLGVEGARRLRYGAPGAAEKALLAAFKANRGGANGRAEAFWELLPAHPEVLEAFDDVFLSGVRPGDTNGLRRAVSGVLDQLGVRRTLVWNERFAAFAAAYEKALPAARRAGVPVPFAVARNAFEAYLSLGRPAQAVAAARTGLSDPKAKPGERYQLALAAALAGLTGADEAKALAAVRACDAEAGRGVPAKDRADAVCAVGSVFQGCGHERLVRGLEAFRKALYRPAPKKRYVVAFSDKPVAGVDDWDKVKAEETAYDRRYGGSLDFLETDVVTGGRAAGSAKEAVPNPSMKVVADENGLHFFFIAPDPKAKEVGLGLVGGGSYEGYIAPGADEPYVCLMMDPGKETVNFFNTTYPTFGHRPLESSPQVRDYRFETRHLDDRIVTYLFLSWRTWATKTPRDGTVWDFENMYWNRAGNSCWNGTESIHGRSTWGELEFRLTPRQRVRILKPLLVRAYARFRAEKVCGARDGCFAHWKDAAVGDPAFYAAELKGLEEQLDKYGELIRPDMTDATVEFLAREALPQWEDVAFEVQRRRARTLAARQTSGVPECKEVK